MISTFNGLGRLTYRCVLPLLRLMIRPTSRCYVLIERQEEFLFIQNWLGRQRWTLPGGGVRGDETSRQAAVRELREELGITIEPAKLRSAAEGRWREDRLGFRYHVFLYAAGFEGNIHPKKPEIIAAEWLSPGDLTSKAVSADIAGVIVNLSDNHRITSADR